MNFYFLSSKYQNYRWKDIEIKSSLRSTQQDIPREPVSKEGLDDKIGVVTISFVKEPHTGGIVRFPNDLEAVIAAIWNFSFTWSSSPKNYTHGVRLVE